MLIDKRERIEKGKTETAEEIIKCKKIRLKLHLSRFVADLLYSMLCITNRKTSANLHSTTCKTCP